MRKILLKTVLVLVGGHLILGLALLLIESVQGINDQGPSYAVGLLFYYLNLPSVWLLKSMGAEPGIALVVAVGTVQWAVLALAIAIAFHKSASALRSITGREKKAGEAEVAGGA